MHVIIANYGNDSLALTAWARAQNLKDVYCLYADTGLAAPNWLERVDQAEAFVRTCGFTPVRLENSFDFALMLKERREFPTRKFQWCAAMLKGVHFVDWLETHDPLRKATVLLAHQRELSPKLKDLPEFVEVSPYYGDRRVWYPLYLHHEMMIQSLVTETPFAWIETRSLECDPCVNSDAWDLKRMSETVVQRACSLEHEVSGRFLETSVYQGDEDIFAAWRRLQTQACSKRRYLFDQGCASPFGCGL